MAGEGFGSGVLSIVALVTAVGAVSMWRILAGLIDHATRLHDTQVKVAQLQIRYLDRARAFREHGGAEEFVVGEAGDSED